MPMVYDISLATAGNLTTNATPNTETDVFFVKAGTRNAMLKLINVVGKGASLSVLSSAVFRVIKLATASTAGTAITPTPKDPGMQASKFTCASAPTIGATRTNRGIFGCSAAGPGQWFAMDPDAPELREGSGACSLVMVSASGLASFPFEWSAEVAE